MSEDPFNNSKEKFKNNANNLKNDIEKKKNEIQQSSLSQPCIDNRVKVLENKIKRIETWTDWRDDVLKDGINKWKSDNNNIKSDIGDPAMQPGLAITSLFN
jgi:gas vesicle protein